jgi:tRNA A-37 threonylcarbamoyl transferase component Bud32/GTP-binding protein EngB required for normal cell division
VMDLKITVKQAFVDASGVSLTQVELEIIKILNDEKIVTLDDLKNASDDTMKKFEDELVGKHWKPIKKLRDKVSQNVYRVNKTLLDEYVRKETVYDGLVTKCEEILTSLQDLPKELKEPFVASIQQAKVRGLEKVKILILGKTSAGKTSLINYLIGRDLGVVLNGKATSYLTKFTYAKDSPYAEIITYKDGRKEYVFPDNGEGRKLSDKEMLKIRTAKLAEILEEENKTQKVLIKQSEIFCDHEVLRTCEIWDSPGLGYLKPIGLDKKAKMGEIDDETLQFAINANIVIYLCDVVAEIADRERIALQLQRLSQVVEESKLFILINKIDLAVGDKLGGERNEITTSVMKKCFDAATQSEVENLKKEVQKLNLGRYNIEKCCHCISLKISSGQKEFRFATLDCSVFDAAMKVFIDRMESLIRSQNDMLYELIIPRLFLNVRDCIELFIDPTIFKSHAHRNKIYEMEKCEEMIAYLKKRNPDLIEVTKKVMSEEKFKEGLLEATMRLSPHDELDRATFMTAVIDMIRCNPTFRRDMDIVMAKISFTFEELIAKSPYVKAKIPLSQQANLGWMIGGAIGGGALTLGLSLVYPMVFLFAGIGAVAAGTYHYSTKEGEKVDLVVAAAGAATILLTPVAVLLWPLVFVLSPLTVIINTVGVGYNIFEWTGKTDIWNGMIAKMDATTIVNTIVDQMIKDFETLSKECEGNYEKRIKLYDVTVESQKDYSIPLDGLKITYMGLHDSYFQYFYHDLKLKKTTRLDDGTSSFGSVYLEKIQNRNFVVKLLDKAIWSKITTEIPTLTLFEETNPFRVSHPNIIQVYHIGYLKSEGCWAIIMQHHDGAVESDKLASKWEGSEKLEIFIQIGEALKELHSHKIMHRDIKPSNIIVVNKIIPILIDFGSSKVESGSKFKTNVGTPFFAAPEVSSNSYDTKIDIYSFGMTMAVLWESPKLTDEAYNALIVDKVTNFKESHLKPLKNHQIYKKVKEITTIIRKCCQHLPGDRDNITKVVDDLKKLRELNTTNK